MELLESSNSSNGIDAAACPVAYLGFGKGAIRGHGERKAPSGVEGRANGQWA